MRQCFIHVKSQFRRKKSGSSIEKFPSLVSLFLGIRRSYNTLLPNFLSIICQVVAYGRLQTKENFKLLALKVVAVAYERWSLTRGSPASFPGSLILPPPGAS